MRILRVKTAGKLDGVEDILKRFENGFHGRFRF